MIRGAVGTDARARFELLIADAVGNTVPVMAAFDTGFDDWLALPPELLRALGLAPEGRLLAELADGRRQEVPYCLAMVVLDGELVDIDVLTLPGEPLAGMQLLAGFRETMDLIPGGPMTIGRLA